MMHLIDSHCHLDFPIFDPDRDQVLQHCAEMGVRDIVIPGVSVPAWSRQIELCQQYPSLHLALGLHPLFMTQHPIDAVEQLAKVLASMPVVAIGEIGLDFYQSRADEAAQTELFVNQLKLAQKFDLPVILHVRKAHDEVLKQLRCYPVKGGIVHAFSGSYQQAEHYMSLGFLFGIGGALTYPRSNKLQKLFAELPLSNVVLETDAPDMPLSGYQGQRNTPENIPKVLAALAELRSENDTEIADTTTANCRRLFGLTQK